MRSGGFAEGLMQYVKAARAVFLETTVELQGRSGLRAGFGSGTVGETEAGWGFAFLVQSPAAAP